MATKNETQPTRMYALDRRKNVAHVVIDEALLATRAADDQRLACKNRRAKIDSFSFGSPGGLPLCPACLKALGPTEEDVLATLEREPLRPAAPNMWNAGTEASHQDQKLRRVLDRLVERGLVVKKPGGWYRLSDAGRDGVVKK